MSVDFMVYTWRRNIPDGREFDRKLRDAGARVRFPEPPDFLADDGFLPVLLDGKASGFELDSSPITEEERAEYRGYLEQDGESTDRHYEILKACDLTVSFCAHGEDEAIAAELVARALAIASRGYFCDPQAGEVIPPPKVD